MGNLPLEVDSLLVEGLDSLDAVVVDILAVAMVDMGNLQVDRRLDTLLVVDNHQLVVEDMQNLVDLLVGLLAGNWSEGMQVEGSPEVDIPPQLVDSAVVDTRWVDIEL